MAPIIIYGSQLENVSNGGNICTFPHKYAGECIIFHIEDLEYSNDPEISTITECRTDGNVNARMAFYDTTTQQLLFSSLMVPRTVCPDV